MISTMTPANRSGSQAPSNSFNRLAAKNVPSMRTKGMISKAACHHFQFHNFQITMKPRSPSTTIVVVTAMP